MARKILTWLVAFIIMVNVTIALVVIFGGKSDVSRVLPNPNGYDDFAKAGKLATAYDDQVGGSNQIGYFDKMAREKLTVLVSSNAEALRLARLGLSHECLVLIKYSTNDTEAFGQLSSIKRLGILICAEGRLAELEGRTNDAAKSYLDGIRYGQESARGGVIISRMVGVACESLATRQLGPLADGLDAQQSRELAQALETISSKEEPVEKTIKEERTWSEKTGGWRWRLTALLNKKVIETPITSVSNKFQSNTRYRNQLTATFASRAFELEKGKRPQSWSDLVPAYLKAVPKDPITGKDLTLPQ